MQPLNIFLHNWIPAHILPARIARSAKNYQAQVRDILHRPKIQCQNTLFATCITPIYTCISSSTSPAPSPPSAVSVSQNGLDSVLVSWTPPSGEADVTGYIIYYQRDGGQRLSENAGATASITTITGLIAGATYSITMVATSSTLPSTETAAQIVTIGKHVPCECLRTCTYTCSISGVYKSPKVAKDRPTSPTGTV